MRLPLLTSTDPITEEDGIAREYPLTEKAGLQKNSIEMPIREFSQLAYKVNLGGNETPSIQYYAISEKNFSVFSLSCWM